MYILKVYSHNIIQYITYVFVTYQVKGPLSRLKNEHIAIDCCGYLFLTRFYLYRAAIHFIYLHSHCLQRKLSKREAQRDSLQREKADLLQRNQQLEVDVQQQAEERVRLEDSLITLGMHG